MCTVLALFFAMSAGPLACEPNVEFAERSFAQPVSAIDVSAPSGDVVFQLAPTPDGEVLVERYLRWNFGQPSASWTVDETSGALLLRSDCDRQTDVCDASYTVTSPLPLDVQCRTRSGHGNVTLHGARAVDISRTDGRVELGQISASIDVRTESGAVTGARLRASVTTVVTSTGAVGLAFELPPERVEITSDSGDITVLVPAGDYAVTIETPDGTSVVDGVQHDDRAEGVIVIETTSGDVELYGTPSE